MEKRMHKENLIRPSQVINEDIVGNNYGDGCASIPIMTWLLWSHVLI